MGTETVIAAVALLAAGLVFTIRGLVRRAQKAEREKSKEALKKARECGPAEPMDAAAVGRFLVESLSDVAAVDYATNPDIRELTSDVLAVARKPRDRRTERAQQAKPPPA